MYTIVLTLTVFRHKIPVSVVLARDHMTHVLVREDPSGIARDVELGTVRYCIRTEDCILNVCNLWAFLHWKQKQKKENRHVKHKAISFKSFSTIVQMSRK